MGHWLHDNKHQRPIALIEIIHTLRSKKKRPASLQAACSFTPRRSQTAYEGHGWPVPQVLNTPRSWHSSAQAPPTDQQIPFLIFAERGPVIRPGLPFALPGAANASLGSAVAKPYTRFLLPFASIANVLKDRDYSPTE